MSTSPALTGSFVKDKVVLVIGAGGGIGRDFALALGREGAKVIVNDVGASVQGQAVANSDSVADWDAAHRMVAQAVDTCGRIDAVINNAGILRDRFFFNMSLDKRTVGGVPCQ